MINFPKIKSVLLLLIAAFVYTTASTAQELDCQVTVQKPPSQSGSEELFRTLQSSIYEFMNTTKWTNHKFEHNERIVCNIRIKITGFSGTRFSGTIQVVSSRPVFGTSFLTPILNYKEPENNFVFEYSEGQSLEFSESRHKSNLTSVLAFYAYVIIGLDYDSFSMMGGTEFLRTAQKIVNNAQSSNDKGWKSYEASGEDNRYFLINNLTNPKYAAIRRGIYSYHRLGLDVMSSKLEQGRNQITEGLKLIQRVHRQKSNLFFIKLFFDAKKKELVDIYKEAFPPEKTKVQTILKEVDPAHITDWEKITKTQ